VSVGVRRLGFVAAIAATGVLVLGACSSGHSSGSKATSPVGNDTPTGDTSSSSTPTSKPSAPPATLTAKPADGAANVSPTGPITVAVADGTLSSVTMTNADGKAIKGAYNTSKSSWQAAESLGYSKTYKVTAKAVNADGKPVTKVSRFTTVTPDNMTMPNIDYIGGNALKNGATYGVGIVPVVHFDESISDKKAAEQALTVTTSPHVTGSWYWADDQNVHWRPQNFYKSGTKVSVSANVYGKQVSPGLYGQADAHVSFTIGAKQITTADDNAPQVNKVRVYRNGKLIRTMNTSMGKHSGVTANGKFIDFHTMQGTYTVIGHENPAIMSSASYGLPANGPGGYAPERIYLSTKISTDGIYLHELDTTVWAQDNGADVSHGCLNLNQENAQWYFDHSTIGDPVIVRHTDGPTIQVWQGGDWSVPWSKWVAGSALH